MQRLLGSDLDTIIREKSRERTKGKQHEDHGGQNDMEACYCTIARLLKLNLQRAFVNSDSDRRGNAYHVTDTGSGRNNSPLQLQKRTEKKSDHKDLQRSEEKRSLEVKGTLV